jgi:hypothetical protein
MIITYDENHSTENLYTEFYWNRATQLGITRNVLITYCVNTVHTVMRLQCLSHIMNIPPLRNYIRSFIEIQQSIYELRENVLITSRVI